MTNDLPRTIGRALAALALALATACAGGNTAEEMAAERAELMNDLADVLADVTDEESLEAARGKLRDLGDELAALTEKWKDEAADLARTAPERMAELAKETGAATQRMMKEMMRLATDPELGPKISGLMDELGDALEKK